MSPPASGSSSAAVDVAEVISTTDIRAEAAPVLTRTGIVASGFPPRRDARRPVPGRLRLLRQGEIAVMGGLLRHVVLALVASLALAAPAHAGRSAARLPRAKAERRSSRSSAGSTRCGTCSPRTATSSPARRLEAGGRRQGREGNETFYVGGDRPEVALPSGVQLGDHPADVRPAPHPTVRLFAKNAALLVVSSLLVEALVENPLNRQVSSYSPPVSHTGYAKRIRRSPPSCSPTSSRSSTRTPSWRWRSASSPSALGAKRQIDDVYVDPFRNREPEEPLARRITSSSSRASMSSAQRLDQ